MTYNVHRFERAGVVNEKLFIFLADSEAVRLMCIFCASIKRNQTLSTVF